MQFVFRVHSVAVKLNYSTCKRDVSRAVGIPSSGDSGHQCTESPLHEIWWGFRPVGIPSSGDSVQWGFRPVGIPGTYRSLDLSLSLTVHPLTNSPASHLQSSVNPITYSLPSHL